MRLLFGIQAPAWLVAIAGIAVVALGYARGNVLAMVIGVAVVVVAAVRQFLL